jgi:formylglycine-generating enzyme required for sulfatase activity
MNAYTGLELLSIPPGRVLLSDRRLQRRWQVDLPAYRLAAVPVTTALYTGEPTHLPAVNVSWWDAVRFCNALSTREGLTPAYHLAPEVGALEETLAMGQLPAGTPQPVTRATDGDAEVSWDESADGYRLPTDAEWEHACRAGTTTPRYGDLDEIAWHRGNADARLHEVAGKSPNAWGLHDMLGNTWDWCWNLYDPNVYGPYRILRGGGWSDEHWSCRAAVRRRSHPTFKIDDVGFRLARSGP